MATFLSRLGRSSFQRRWLVTGIWVALLVVFGIGAFTLSGPMTNTVTIPGTESQQAIEHLEQKFPEAAVDTATARVAIAAPEGAPLDRDATTEVVEALSSAPKVAHATDPFHAQMVSPDGQIALVQVTYQVSPFDLTESDREALLSAAEPGRAAGLQVEFSGSAIQPMVVTQASEGVGVVIAAIVLIITFGSLVAAGLPLLTALIGVGIGMAGISVATGIIDLNANTPILALMLGLAVGIDYALFIVSRYRTELREGREPEDAAAHAVGTAGSAVVFAGLTVIIALAGLTIVGIPLLGEMGLAASVTVAVAVLIAITLLPAILGFTKKKVLGRKERNTGEYQQPRMVAGERWAAFVERHRLPVFLVALVGLAVVAIPAADMRLGLPTDSTAPEESTQRQAYELISEGFGPGTNGPLIAVLESDHDARPAAGLAFERIQGLEGVAQVMPPEFNAAGDTALLTVIPATGPDSAATEDLVALIRDQADPLAEQTGAELLVTGETAMNIDISHRMADALLPYLALIVGLAFILLMLVFRSVVVPLKATLGFLGSVAATFGAVVAVFQWGWLSELFGVDATGPIMSMLPILLIGVLFGLAMDYQVFLVTRMREEYVHGATPDNAITAGFRYNARVVVAAALIMTSVFAGFVLAQETLIQSIGFALAFGVAVDAFVVRMTVVPAIMSLLGRSAWWLPRWLSRILPNVDVEGEKLTGGRPEGGQESDRTLEPV